MVDQAAWAARMREEMAYEAAREALPEGFPALTPIPTARYTDPGFFALELARVFRRTWLMVGREEDFAGAGDYRTFDRAGAPLVIVRGEDGALRAFYNTCQHRGAPVVRDACGTAKRLQCQYHSWVYGLDGALLQVPDRRDFGALDEAGRALRPVRCESYAGWVFVNEDAAAPSLVDWLGPIAREWAPLRGETLRAHATRRERLPANWKIVADAFLETYHLRTIHTQTVAKLLDHRGAAMGLFEYGHSRMITPKWPSAMDRLLSDALPLDEIEGLHDVYRETNPAYSVFPNLITPLDTIGFPFIQFWPVDATTTDVEWTFYGPPATSDEQREAWKLFVQVFDGVMDEDFRNLEPMQQSVASGALESIPLSYQERRIHHMHEEIDRLIGEADVPEALRVVQVLAPHVERG